MSILDSLYQDESWGKEGEVRPIAEMETRHIKNVVSWIWRNIESLKLAAEAEMAFGYQPSAEAAALAYEQAFTELLEMKSRDWFTSLPVVEAFRKVLAERNEQDSTAQWLARMLGKDSLRA